MDCLESRSLFSKRTPLRFFFLTVNKRKEIYVDIYLYTWRYTLRIFNVVYIFSYSYRVSTLTPSHIPTPSIQHVNINVVSVLGSSLEFVY